MVFVFPVSVFNLLFYIIHRINLYEIPNRFNIKKTALLPTDMYMYKMQIMTHLLSLNTIVNVLNNSKAFSIYITI